MGDVLVFISLATISFVVVYCGTAAFLFTPKQAVKRKLADKLADQADELRNKQEAKEDKWIAELEEQVEILKASLITLRKEPDCTVSNKQAQLLAQNSMAMAQCTLAMLYKRRDYNVMLAKPKNDG